MDLAMPTTSTSSSKPTKPKRARKSKRFTASKRARKSKNVPIYVEDQVEDEEPVIADEYFKIEKILRKTEFALSNGETKYLVSWPNTWEPEGHLGNCPKLLEQFEAGLPQIVEIDDDNTNPIPAEWVVERILEKRYDEDGNAEYLLKWQNTWIDAKDIQGKLLKDFEDRLSLERLKTSDTKNAGYKNNNNNNNNNDDDIDSGVKGTIERDRSTRTDKMPEMESNTKKPQSGEKRVNEPTANSPRVIEMELITLSEQRQLDRIIDIGMSNDGSFSFMLKFKTGELGIMKRQMANIKYTQEVIAFYQRRIKFS